MIIFGVFMDAINSITSWISNSNNLIIVATFLLVIATYIYSITSRRTMWYKALLDAKKDYRSPEMMTAVMILYDLYRKYGKDECRLKMEYSRILEEDNKKIEQENWYKSKFNLIKGSLSYQRRLVLTFYFHLYDLYKHNILPKEMIFGYFHKDNLSIIPKILIPIHMEQGKYDKADTEIAKQQLDKLKELYDESIQYQKDIDC